MVTLTDQAKDKTKLEWSGAVTLAEDEECRLLNWQGKNYCLVEEKFKQLMNRVSRLEEQEI